MFPAAYILRLIRNIKKNSWPNVLLIGWTGSRGVLSLAAALSLPSVGGRAFPQSRQILLLTFGVILFTLVVQGLSLPALVRALHFESDDGAAREEHTARIAAAEAAGARLEEIAGQPERRGKVLDGLLARYQAQLRHLQEAPADSSRKGFSSEFERLEREAIAAERAALRRLRDDNTISDETRRAVAHDLDLQEVQLGDDGDV